MRELVNERLKDSDVQAAVVPVDSDLSSDLYTLFRDGLEQNHVSAFFKVFWEEQINLNKRSKHGRRFHPELIRFCISLAMKSSSAYEQLRGSGVLILPSSRTLFEYRAIHSSSPGFLDSTKAELTEKAKTMKEHERLIVISMDEIKVKENIVYSSSTDKMVGFVDLGASRNRNENSPSSVPKRKKCG